MPEATNMVSSTQALKIASAAAGNTKIIYSGGEMINAQDLLSQLYENIHHADVAGIAAGRNIFQRSLAESIILTQAISAIIYDNVDLKVAIAHLNQLHATP